MWRLSDRRFGPELMDDPNLRDSELEKVLIGLRRLNFISQTTNALFHLVLNVSPPKDRPLRVLDLGSGGGEVLCDLVKRLSRKGYVVHATGTDINAYSVDRSKRYAQSKNLDVSFHQLDAIAALKTIEFDLVTSVLFLHHLQEEDIFEVLRLIKQKAGVGLAMIDLERSISNYILVNLATSLVSNSKILKQDGLQSVQSALTILELKRLAKELLPSLEVERKFPCRMSVQWRRDGSSYS